MKTLYTLFLLIALLPAVKAQTAADCSVDPDPTPILNVLALIGSQQPFTAGIDVTYCATSASPFGSGVIGNVAFSQNTVYPYTVRLTDITTNTVTIFTNFGDNIDVFGNRLYFIEIMPEEEGNGDIQFVPDPSLADFINPVTINIDIERNLPVTWEQPLSHVIVGKLVKFSWSVSDEENVADYRLQRSTGGDWTDVATQPASQGRSTEVSYAATDLHGVEDANYRVKQTDFDGRFSYSNIIVVPGTGLARELSIFPNPATEVISFVNPVAISGLRLLNTAGRPIRELHDQGTNGTLSLAGLPAGIYLLEVIDVNGERTTRRVLRR